MPTPVKMNERFARRLLANKSCEIYVPKACSWFTTAPGIKDDLTVFVPEEEIRVPLADIQKIRFSDRFGSECAMEVSW